MGAGRTEGVDIVLPRRFNKGCKKRTSRGLKEQKVIKKKSKTLAQLFIDDASSQTRQFLDQALAIDFWAGPV